MIVADTSAFMAILLREPDAELYSVALAQADTILVGAPTVFELRLAMHRRFGRDSTEIIDTMIDPSIEIVPWTAEHVPIALDALQRFGGRPTQLNFGDCMTYAVARSLDLPLLYKGNDFARTDIRSAL